MAGDGEKFVKLLDTLLSTDNPTRTQAEEAYNHIPTETKVMFLLGSIHNVQLGEERRQMAAVLLRRLFSDQFMEFYLKVSMCKALTTCNVKSDCAIRQNVLCIRKLQQDRNETLRICYLSPEGQTQFKEQIFLTVQQEQSGSTRKKVCEVAAEVARNLIDEEGNNQWPEFVHFLFQCAYSETEALKESALRMFTAIPGAFGNQQANYLDLIKQMLQQSLVEGIAYEVQFEAVRAVCAFIIMNDKEVPIQKHFSDLLPRIVQVTAVSIEKENDMVMKSLIDVAETAPKFLRPQLDNILELYMKVLSNEEYSGSWRQLALELIVTLAENAPAMLRKVGGKYIPLIVQQTLKMMTDLEDDAEWSLSDDIVEDDNDSIPIIGESALDRLACGLGGRTMMPHITQNIWPMLANSDWKYRHAALMALSSAGEGCHRHMEAALPQIMDGLLNFLQDPHERVRYAACSAIGQISTNFAPLFEKKFHDKVIPALLKLMDDSIPRVQAHAGAVLVNFSEQCPKNILTQHLTTIMAKLVPVLHAKFDELVEKGTTLVLEQTVTTIACVADKAEEHFVEYYDHLMPMLKFIIDNACTYELKILRGKAIECVSLIGLAVGAERFMHDGSEVISLLLKTQTESDAEDDDPETSYLISAWARICKILGKQFEQYLPLVMGPVLKAAAVKPEVALLHNEDIDSIEADSNWQFISIGEQKSFGVKTSGLEDKASACEMLVCYARELKEGFADYVEDVVKLMVPMLKFYFHDGVRSCAAESLPYLLDCAKIKGPQYMQGMWNYMCPELLNAIECEAEIKVLQELMYSLGKCIQILGNGCLSVEAMAELLIILDKLMKEHFNKVAARQEKRKDEDYDEVVEEELEDEDNNDVCILSKVVDVLHALFLAYKVNFYPYFDRIVGNFVKCLEPQMPWSDHQWALCVFDDTIEFGGPACVKYQEYFLLPMMNCVTSKIADVRQAAAFGWGVLAQYGGDSFKAAIAEAVPKLIKMITSADSKGPENINATENAISAVTKILKYNSTAVDVNEILPLWLTWLPVWEDEEESLHIYGYLCDLIESNHPIILGPHNANLPILETIISEAFAKDAISMENEVAKRMLMLSSQIKERMAH